MSLRKNIFVVSFLGSFLSVAAFASDAAATGGSDGFGKLAAALAIGIAAFGGALGQARTAAAALEGMARNPSAGGSIRTAMIIGLALIESLVLYAFVIAFMIK